MAIRPVHNLTLRMSPVWLDVHSGNGAGPSAHAPHLSRLQPSGCKSQGPHQGLRFAVDQAPRQLRLCLRHLRRGPCQLLKCRPAPLQHALRLLLAEPTKPSATRQGLQDTSKPHTRTSRVRIARRFKDASAQPQRRQMQESSVLDSGPDVAEQCITRQPGATSSNLSGTAWHTKGSVNRGGQPYQEHRDSIGQQPAHGGGALHVQAQYHVGAARQRVRNLLPPRLHNVK